MKSIILGFITVFLVSGNNNLFNLFEIYSLKYQDSKYAQYFTYNAFVQNFNLIN